MCVWPQVTPSPGCWCLARVRAQADTTGQLVHIGMQAQKAETEAGPFVRISFVLTGIHPVCYFAPINLHTIAL